ncbi:MAG: tetratricopeptide repeat protein [Desulfobacterales bacterium]|nr:tetratricopeptide repeat protein [Desulfobacterales bacterium]
MIKKGYIIIRWWFSVAILGLFAAGGAAGALTAGQAAPAFSLMDIAGQAHALAQINGREMAVLFFFDAGSSASQEGLLMLGRLLKQYPDKQLTVWGITRSSQDAVRRFQEDAQLQFPVLLDPGDVSGRYDAKIVLPVVCILGPGSKILDYFQGGGQMAETMLVRLAERQIHREQPQLARAIASSVSRKNPTNAQAKAVEGYAAMAEGKNDEAAQVFKQIVASGGADAAIGQEGQAAVLARQGQADKALALAEEVTRKAPARVMAHKIKGDLLMSRGDRQAATSAYEAAAKQSEAPAFQKAEACHQLGRLYTQEGSYDKARNLFDQAVQMDPYYIIPTSNKGVTYEKQGMWDRALAEYRQTLALDQTDTMAAVLSRKAEQMLALQKDAAGKQRMDQLVRDLVQRYKSQKSQSVDQPGDDWTSRPMILTFVEIQEKGGLSERDGLAIVLATRLGEMLNSSGRVQVVERALLESLLTELNLGSSELADPETALRLGKVLAAKLVGTGSLLYLSDSTLLNLRMIDTETTAIAQTVTLRIAAQADLERELYNLNRSILRSVMDKYPLQGFVVQADAKEAMINLGSRQGVATGTAFDVIEAGEAITYKGRALRGATKTVARLEVVRVEPDLCYARIVEQQRALARDDKVKEMLPQEVTSGGGNAK